LVTFASTVTLVAVTPAPEEAAVVQPVNVPEYVPRVVAEPVVAPFAKLPNLAASSFLVVTAVEVYVKPPKVTDSPAFKSLPNVTAADSTVAVGAATVAGVAPSVVNVKLATLTPGVELVNVTAVELAAPVL
jgi:hypothetical protein